MSVGKKIEYQIRAIDKHGDAQEIWCFGGSGARSKSIRVFDAMDCDDEYVAFVIERTTYWIGPDDEMDYIEIDIPPLKTKGSIEAINLWSGE